MRYVLTVIMVGMLLCLTATAQGVELPETARLLPAETFVFATVDNLDDLTEKFRKTNYYQLYKDPSMQEFFNKAEEKIREFIEEEEIGQFGELIFEDKLCPTGKIAIAGILEKNTALDEGDISLIVMAQWKKGFDQVRKAIEKDIQKQLDEGAGRRKETFRGAEIITVITEVESCDPEADAEPITEMEYFCFFEDLAFYCDNLEVLKFSISQIKKPNGQTLWDDADYQAARKAVGPQYDLEIYLNLKAVLKAVMAIEDDDPVMNPKNIATLLGLDQLTGIACGVEVTANSRQSLGAKVMIRNPGTPRGIMKMLQLASIPFKPPVFVSPQTCRVAYFNLDFAKAGNELGRILAGFSPMAAVVMTTPITAPEADGSPGVVLKTDILDQLGSQLIFAEEITDNAPGDEVFKSEQLFAIAIKDKQRIARALSKIHSQFIATMKPETQREFLGHTIYSIPLASFMGISEQTEPMDEATAQMTLPVFAFTVTDSHVVLGAENAVEQALRRLSNPDSKGLDQKPWHQYALSTVPSSAQVAGFDNMILYGKELWKQLKKGMDSGTLQITLENAAVEEFMPLLKMLPEFEAIQKYFGLTVDWGQSRDDGLYYEINYLNWKEKDN